MGCCYGLSICVPPKFTLTLMSNMMELVVKLLGSKLGLDEDMRAEHHDGTSVLTEEEDARAHCLSAIVDRAKWQPLPSQKNGPHQTQNWPAP